MDYLHLLGKAHYDLGQDEAAAEYFRQTLTALEGVTSPLAARMRGEITQWEVECSKMGNEKQTGALLTMRSAAISPETAYQAQKHGSCG